MINNIFDRVFFQKTAIQTRWHWVAATGSNSCKSVIIDPICYTTRHAIISNYERTN
jgi:hypothetical protein